MLDCNKLQIGTILRNRKIEVKEAKRPINYTWEEAKQFCFYCGIGKTDKDVVFILRLFKVYGKPKVLAIQSWLKDNKFEQDKVKGLIVWRLKTVAAKKAS